MAQTLLNFWGKPPVKPPEPAETPQTLDPANIEPPPSFKVVLRVDGDKLKTVQKNPHPFFQQRKYNVTTTAAKSAKKILINYKHDPIEPVLPSPVPHMAKLPRRTHASIVPTQRRKLVELTCFDLVPVKRAQRVVLNDEQLLKLAKNSLARSAFDLGKYEHQLWTCKYAPQSPKAHVNKKTRQVAEWLKQQFHNLKTKRPDAPIKRKRGPLDDFVVEDDEPEDEFKPFLVVYGPSGSGKTSAIHACCAHYDALVVEYNQSIRKSGTNLREILSGVTQSHVVHANAGRRYHCAVLIDEADIDLDQDTQFWPTLKEFAYKSRRPIVLTCETLGTLPQSVVNDVTSTFIYMPPPEPTRVVELASNIALREGYLLDNGDLAKLVVIFKSNVPKTLMHLQFWCQMGVGGSMGAIEWLRKQHEPGRVISLHNNIQLPPIVKPAEEPQEFERLLRAADELSLGTTSNSYFKLIRRLSCDWHGLVNDDGLETVPQLITEILPFMRDIARDDLDRQKASTGMRASRRSLASFGMQAVFFKNPEDILSTFYK